MFGRLHTSDRYPGGHKAAAEDHEAHDAIRMALRDGRLQAAAPQSPHQNKSWMERHPVWFGLIVGAGEKIAEVYLGMPLLHSMDLDAVAEACARAARSTCFFCVAPLKIAGGTGSPVAPVCIL